MFKMNGTEKSVFVFVMYIGIYKKKHREFQDIETINFYIVMII